VRQYKKSSAPKGPQSTPARRVGRPRRTQVSEGFQDDAPGESSMPNNGGSPSQTSKSKLSRIKFRVKPAELPLIHPDLVLRRQPQYNSLREFLGSAAKIPVDQGGLYIPEDASDYTPATIARDAQILIRLEDAAKPGGVLHPATCSLYQPEEQDQPPVQYSHRDHLNRAAVEFRKLMVMEERKHRSIAKRLAEACKDEWYRRQPKTAEQLEAEERRKVEGRYRILMKSLQATWENVRAEVNRRRLLEWEAQEQARVRKALNEAVDLSTQKLEARRVQIDSEAPSDEDESDNEDDEDIAGSNSEAGESNMSSTESEVDEEQARLDAMEDENLTQEELRLKYSTLPNLPSEPADEDMDEDMNDASDAQASDVDQDMGMVELEGSDDSDESIDMDDDMGASDVDRGSEEDSDEEDEGEEDGPSTSNLLGLLDPSDLKSMYADQVDSATPQIEDITEEDEVSLVSGEAPLQTADKDLEKDGVVESIVAPGASNGTLDVPAASPGRSSQPTLRTTESRQEEIDSASSVEPHRNSRQVTQNSTPQPGNNLKTPVPFLLRGTLREYQHYGLDWLAGLYANNTNGILADEMGLGKTIQTIALLAHLACEHEVWGPHLVIVPTSVMLNWEMEFKKWCPGFKILTYYGTQEERKKKRMGWKSEDSWNVCITSYQLVIQDQQVFKRRKWHYMILDEAHNIKNFQSQRWQTMLTFNTQARLLLTGTPLQNNLTELWSLLYFLMPSDGTEQGVGGFANLKEFQDWFKKPSEQILEHGRDQMDDEARAIISKLHKVLRPYLLRRLKADVEKQMPAKYEHVEFCRLSKRQRELYDGFLNREDTRGTLASGNYLSIINCLMQLRKVCNHPDLFIDRPIMTSFPMEKSVVADFEIKDLLVRRRLLDEHPMSRVSLDFLNLVPTKHESLSDAATGRSAILSAQKTLMNLRESQRIRAQNAFTKIDPSTAKSNLVYLESASRWGRFEELQHCVYLNALRRQQTPIYGTRLVELLTIGVGRVLPPQPKRRDKMLTWLEDTSPSLTALVPSLSLRAQSMKSTIQKFACVTPPVIARNMTSLILSPKGINTFQNTVATSESDPFHEARMRLSIQFPDKRLLQYDCGKLQTLAKLLRKLQAGGHRALIFTQMTKVLDILEQFLNIHGHKYLRLDGSTKIEQRQILTDRFNNDTRILAFILSTRSGGLGINLTGADTVIFYDLDWNPAMDKQCQDRCHRIGQTRDVHIYRLVSEHTIEANILRKANQKRMLDDVVIQEGEFTTDYFNKMSVNDVLDEGSALLDGDAVANAAMDRVLGGPDNSKDVQRVLAQAEDQEDVVAARVAEREVVQTDAADFDENAIATSTPLAPQDDLATPAGEGTPAFDDDVDMVDEDELNAWGERIASTDEYMLHFMADQLKDTPVELPKDKNRSKRGKDHRNRTHRVR
jgi:helicase SWR1